MMGRVGQRGERRESGEATSLLAVNYNFFRGLEIMNLLHKTFFMFIIIYFAEVQLQDYRPHIGP